MHRMARFEKVSKEQFYADLEKQSGLCESVRDLQLYEQIQLPRRATAGSAGYDFFLPMDLCLRPQESVRIPSGIRCHMQPGWVLTLYPRSSLGCRYHLQLDNTVGVIDADYVQAKNEGHILIQITNHSPKGETLCLSQGSAFVQGVFLSFGITEDDAASDPRSGGFGSTG